MDLVDSIEFTNPYGTHCTYVVVVRLTHVYKFQFFMLENSRTTKYVLVPKCLRQGEIKKIVIRREGVMGANLGLAGSALGGRLGYSMLKVT